MRCGEFTQVEAERVARRHGGRCISTNAFDEGEIAKASEAALSAFPGWRLHYECPEGEGDSHS